MEAWRIAWEGVVPVARAGSAGGRRARPGVPQPAGHTWRETRSSNALERFNRGICDRSDVMGASRLGPDPPVRNEYRDGCQRHHSISGRTLEKRKGSVLAHDARTRPQRRPTCGHAAVGLLRRERHPLP